MHQHEPFRCLGCGLSSTSATRCRRCGGRSFQLVAPGDAPFALRRASRPMATVGAAEPPAAQIVPIHRAHALRARRARRHA